MTDPIVYIPEPLHPAALERISSVAEIRTEASEAGEAQIAIIRNHVVDAPLVDRMPMLRLVIKHGAGMDRIDTGLLESMGIHWESTPGYNANGVVELAILQAMRLLRNVHEDGTAPGSRELSGQRAVVLGLGKIGGGIARILTHGFGTEVRSYDPYAAQAPEGVDLVADAGAAVDGVDVVFVTCPLTPETAGLMNAGLLDRLAHQAVVVNTARAPIVDNAAMAAALTSGRVRGYAHDFQNEPDAFDSLTTPGTLLSTEHIGGATEEALWRTGDAVAQILEANVKAVMA